MVVYLHPVKFEVTEQHVHVKVKVKLGKAMQCPVWSETADHCAKQT